MAKEDFEYAKRFEDWLKGENLDGIQEDVFKLRIEYEKLQKENAELKESNEYKKGVCKELAHQANVLQEQLTKAKEIIKDLMSFSVQLCDCRHTIDFEKTREQAEQFLKGENIILEDAQAGNSPFDADEVFNKEIKAYPEEK